MPTYYINKAEPQEQIKTKYGNWLVPYRLELGSEDGNTYEAEILQKPETPPPSGNIKGTITAGPYGNKFQKDKPQMTTDGTTSYASGRTPEERNSIVRQHSQHMAVMWVVTQQKKNPNLDLNYEYLKGVIDWFQEDARA